MAVRMSKDATMTVVVCRMGSSINKELIIEHTTSVEPHQDTTCEQEPANA